MKKLIVIGAGPAGLSTAINAASEGLAVTVLEKADALGGQFRESFDIENFPGAPLTTGRALSGSMINQARQFGVEFQAPSGAAFITTEEGRYVVETEDNAQVDGDAVVLALGLQYRRLDTPGLAELMGRGVYCGPTKTPAHGAVAIVGGGNSAGQEALRQAQVASRKVYLIIRGAIVDKMSSYLIDMVRKLPNVEVIEGCQIEAVDAAKGWLKAIMLDSGRVLAVNTLLLYIGAVPHTRWLLRTTLARLDPNGFIKTGTSLSYFETNSAGLFAIGDARRGSIKRIGAAVGEGCMVVPAIHTYLARA